ncbi:hypothetical protein [Flagellimonas eckloniae]|uniref:Heparinase n=1 Tax=Flagellimonas eckloniae TaxID=346185 RepID=A0A0Q0WWW2_9FLAO|nr:hypothetical protein [Allomuricauda eckloniae]KQC29951.1 hypothetical protein AAY42_08695 [Allomuricauda eckloniae]
MRNKWGKIICIVLGNLILATILLSCIKLDKDLLDINKYFASATKDIIYPSSEQIEMLKAVLPKEAFQPAPPISDRTYWNKIAAMASGKNYLKLALSELDEKPEVPIADSIYRRANLEGNRGIYKPRYYRTMERLEHFILAECIENKGRFLSQINTYLNAIMDMKSWLHPNHDDNENGVLEGRRVSIDLGARRFGSDLALAQVLVGEKLSKNVNEKITEQLKWRIVDTYLTSCKKNDINNRWIKSTSNWNSVCTSGSMFVAIATSTNEDERLEAVGSALNSMKHYLSGFGEDGYCSEGAGYWNYGFGHYLYLAQILHDYTDGRINLFDAGNPEKLKNVGNFPETYQIHTGICAPFSDGVSKVSNDGGFAYNMSARKYGAGMPVDSGKRKTHDSFSAAFQLIEWEYEALVDKTKKDVQPASELQDYTYFDDVGMVISRGKQNIPLSIAIKAGHNSENHNHSDVGTYTIVLDDQIMSGDIGAPSYIAGAFAPDNPARSSWGHPVPRINHTLQSNGREFEGTITATKFTENLDRVVMDIKSAYEVPSLTKLIRTMENDKSGVGAVSIIDEFSSTEAVAFGTAIMTLSEYEIINANTVVLHEGNQKLKAAVSSDTGALKIRDELVPVKHLREGAPAYRIGVDFTEPIKEGSITVKYTPIL